MKASIVQMQEIKIEKMLNFDKDLSGQELLAEILRNELSARRVSSRRSLCSRVIKTIEPFQKTTIEHVKEVLAELERNGDVTKGSSGQIAAAPLRAVYIGQGRYRLHGCIVTQKLLQSFPDSDLSLGYNRFLTVNEADDIVSGKISSLGGIVLTPERWVGLTRNPYADRKWLDSLEPLLENHKKPAGSLDNGINDGWQKYNPEEKGKAHNERWKKSGGDDNGKLWRGWHERGWYVFAWTSGKSPSLTSCLKLTSDHVRRTMFALDREADNPVPCSITEENDRVFFRIAGFLPVGEYRYLSTIGEYTGKQGNYYCFNIPSDNWQKVQQMICDRLGIKTKQEES